MNFILMAASGAAATTSGTQQVGGLGSFFPLISLGLVFVLMYFIMIRPQKKKEKEIQQMRSNLQVGDEITTSGGIVGIVASIKEDTVVIETGSDRSKIRVKRWAIQQNNTIHDDAE